MQTKHFPTLSLAALVLFAGFNAAAQDLKPLKIELPTPFYGGTPLDYWSSNLEPKSTKPREPFMAPEGATNLALGKPVTMAEDTFVYNGEAKMITDGVKDYHRENLVEIGPGKHYVQIDLGQPSELYAILVWHFHEGDKVYFDVVVQVSSDPEFKKDVTTLFNNDVDNSLGLGAGKEKEYIETYEGRLVDAKSTKAQYVRCWSNGNTGDDLNNYLEIEAWGKPVK